MLRCFKVWSCISILFSTGAIDVLMAEEITFKFNYPDQLSFVQTLKTIKKKMSEVGQYQVDSTVSDVELKVNRFTEGYDIVATPSSMIMYRNGQLVESPIIPILNGLVITYKVNEDGQLTDILGYDEFLSRIETSMPPQVLETMKSIVNKEALIAKETEEWNGRIGFFVGASVKLGDSWIDTTNYLLPTGESITFYTVTSFDEWIDFGGRKCLKVSSKYDSDPTELAGIIDKAMQDISSVAKDTANVPTSEVSSLSGGGHRLIDPSTMIIYREQMNRTMKIIVNQEGQKPLLTTTVEERDYSFKFTK